MFSTSRAILIGVNEYMISPKVDSTKNIVETHPKVISKPGVVMTGLKTDISLDNFFTSELFPKSVKRS